MTITRKTDPRTLYRNAIDMGKLQPDQRQFEVVGKLQDLYERLTTGAQGKPDRKATGGFLSALFSAASAPVDPSVAAVRGLYLWGGVGRGKTLLCDMFYEGISIEQKRRVHFHRFMREIHELLAQIGNEVSPLDIVAEKLAAQCRVLILDEMHVNDITDAMIMSGLLQGLFSRGVTLLTTSNFPPDDLYKDGLQRARFLPAIELLKVQTEVVFLGGDLDYRLRALQNARTYLTPLDHLAQSGMAAYFQEVVAAGESESGAQIEINNRLLLTIEKSASVVWLSFDELCNTPRSTDDYIELARNYDTVLISSIPVMDDLTNDMARRFINLIDEFYDRNVKIVLSAEKEPTALYAGTRLNFEFERTSSRLVEMQSVEYLAKSHIP